MATGKALDGKPYAGNPHVRFDEGEVAPAATPRRGSLLYIMKTGKLHHLMSAKQLIMSGTMAVVAAIASSGLSAYNVDGDSCARSGQTHALALLDARDCAEGFSAGRDTWVLKGTECPGMFIIIR